MIWVPPNIQCSFYPPPCIAKRAYPTNSLPMQEEIYIYIYILNEKLHAFLLAEDPESTRFILRYFEREEKKKIHCGTQSTHGWYQIRPVSSNTELKKKTPPQKKNTFVYQQTLFEKKRNDDVGSEHHGRTKKQQHKNSMK